MKAFSTLPVIILLVTLSGCSEKVSNERPAPTDGPYVEIHENDFKLEWLCNGEVKSTIIPRSNEVTSFSECGLSAQIFDDEHNPRPLEYQGEMQVAALSDVHGQYDLMLKLLKNNNIIDQNNNWKFGTGHFVITGDVFDRGDKVTEILWFLYALDKQASDAGGKLHLLLGNHEVMVMNGKLRYLHTKYQQTAKLLNRPFADLFLANTLLGTWLRSKSILVKINDSLFVHGGLHPNLVSADLSISAINGIFKEHLVESELEAPRVGMAEYLHKREGPIWFRGYFGDARISSEQVNGLLSHFHVKRIIVGHTSQQKIETRYQGSVIAIDSSIKKGEYGEILFIDGLKKWRGSLTGEVLPLD